MIASTVQSFNRHININNVIDYITETGLKLESFELSEEFIQIEVSGKCNLGIQLFIEFLDELDEKYWKENFGLSDTPKSIDDIAIKSMATALISDRKVAI